WTPAGPEPEYSTYYWVVEDNLVVISAEYFTQGTCQVTRLSAPETIEWSQSVQDCSFGEAGATGARHLDDLLWVAAVGQEMVLGWQDGRIVLPTGYQYQIFPDNIVLDGSGGSASSEVPLATGASATIRLLPESQYLLDFQEKWPEMAVVADSTGISLMDPSDGTIQWQTALGSEGYGYGAWDGADRVYGSNIEHIWAVDLTNGTLLWEVSEPIGASEGGWGFEVLPDGTLLLQAPSPDSWEVEARLLDPATGERLYSTSEFTVSRVFDGGVFSPTGEYFITHSENSIDRLDPYALTDFDVGPLPAGFPDCPVGMAPISWIEYTGGQVLICGSADGMFDVQAKTPAGDVPQPSELSFSGQEWEVVFTDGSIIKSASSLAKAQLTNADGKSEYLSAISWYNRVG
ncbi:MAG: hypothetical protein FWG16_02470, partial [Micrococcales bacterium]|nr:hypothetical protein [Micrococcales bacterium]